MGLLKTIKSVKMCFSLTKQEAKKAESVGLEAYVNQIKSSPDIYGTLEPEKAGLLERAAEACKGYKPEKGSCKDGCCSVNDPLKPVYTSAIAAGMSLRYSKAMKDMEHVTKQSFTTLEKELVYLESKKR